jgi:hypothetical protein
MVWKASALGAVALLVFLEIRSAPASSALPGPAIIRITDREVRFNIVDVGRRGRSPGDVEITRRLLFNKRIKQSAIGRAELVCTVLTGNSRHCTGTYVLPAGKIAVSGEMRYRQFFQLAVTGGTGFYNNVRGTLTVTSLGRKPRRDIVFFRLVV